MAATEEGDPKNGHGVSLFRFLEIGGGRRLEEGGKRFSQGLTPQHVTFRQAKGSIGEGSRQARHAPEEALVEVGKGLPPPGVRR